MASVSVEDIADEFDVFGEEVDDTQLEKFQAMCISHSISANNVVDQWMAFSSSRKVNLNEETLEVFDREWLPKKVHTSLSKTPQRKQNRVLNKCMKNNSADDDMELLSSYSTPERALTSKRQITPENNNSAKKKFGDNRVPLSFSPVAVTAGKVTPSAKFSTRTNAGEVVSSFGKASDAMWKGKGRGCQLSPFEPNLTLTSQSKFMFQKMSDKAHVLNDTIQDMSTILQNAHGIEEFSHVALPSQETVTIVGRVCCDSVGKLNSQSVVLEGSRETSCGKCISLDLSELSQYSLFPGQIVAGDGVNATGRKFSFKQLFKPVPLPFPDVNFEFENGEELTMVVATGPYAPSDGLDYSPLSDLVKYINENQPDLCVLMGPFVDTRNTCVNSGELEESFEELFNKQMQEIGKATKDTSCKVVIVPSSRDAHHCHSVYPQPPFTLTKQNADGSKKLQSELEMTKHLTFVSDPSTICANGIVIGLTSTDILMHLTKSEMSMGCKGGLDRMGRLSQHILHQHSYYPLYPPSEDVNIDYELWEVYAKLPVTPHVLLIPSDLKAFVKDIDGCCCINPGRLTTGIVGGTYARVMIDPKNLSSKKTVTSSLVAQIVKI